MKQVDVDILEKTIQQSETKTLQHLSSAISRELENNNKSLTEESKKLLILLKKITGMSLTPDSTNTPFRPIIQLTDGRRSAEPNDLSEEDILVISKVAQKISYAPLKARIFDLLWICKKPRDPNYARSAIDNYIEKLITPETWFHSGRSYFERAYRLSKQLRDKERINKIEQQLLNTLKSPNKNLNELTYSISELVLDIGALKEDRSYIAERLEQYGETQKQSADFINAISHFRLSSRAYQSDANEEKSVQMLVKEADSHTENAKKHLNGDKGQKLVSNSLFGVALQAYRRIPNKFREAYQVEEKISELRQMLTETGANVLEEMGTHSFSLNGIEELIESSKNHVSQKDSEFEALLYFSTLITPSDYELLKEEEENAAQKYPLSSMFEATQYSNDGRIVAKTPPIGFSGNENSSDIAIEHRMMRSFLNSIDIYVRHIIHPALTQILGDHSFTKNFIFEICCHSDIVPESNTNLISHALWLGFEMDFATAIHLVAPQVEKIVRDQLKLKGAHTTHIDKNNIEHENGLSTLLDLPEAKETFGKDLLFELKAVFSHSIGPNLRNEVAHGLMTDSEAYNSCPPVYAWWMLLRLVVQSVPLVHNDMTNDTSEFESS